MFLGVVFVFWKLFYDWVFEFMFWLMGFSYFERRGFGKFWLFRFVGLVGFYLG